jgi:hypothetical protein
MRGAGKPANARTLILGTRPPLSAMHRMQLVHHSNTLVFGCLTYCWRERSREEMSSYQMDPRLPGRAASSRLHGRCLDLTGFGRSLGITIPYRLPCWNWAKSSTERQA